MLKKSGLYVVIDKELCVNKNISSVTKAILDGGADIIQLRDKISSTREALKDAFIVKRIADDYSAKFIVNNEVDIAFACDCDGVHLGQDDLPIEYARRILGEDKIIGLSATNFNEAVKAQGDGADYIGLGPIFYTATKKDAGYPVGLNCLRRVTSAVKIPVVPIGGIAGVNIAKVASAGAKWAAVSSAVLKDGDIRNSTKTMKAMLRRACKNG